MEALYHWCRWLYDDTAINYTICYDPFDRARMAHGILTTIELAATCLVFSVIIGVVGAWLQGSRFVWTKRIVQGYIQFFRNTPPLVQLYFFYFALGNLMPRSTNAYGFQEPMLDNFDWAVIALSFFAGAFNVEIFRSGIEAVPTATVEAAEALGYSRLKAYMHIVLPLAFRVALPALNNNLVNLIKTTTIAYAIAVPEMLYVSNQIWSDNVNVPEMMIFLLLAYVGLVALLVWGMHRWEHAMRIPGYGGGT